MCTVKEQAYVRTPVKHALMAGVANSAPLGLQEEVLGLLIESSHSLFPALDVWHSWIKRLGCFLDTAIPFFHMLPIAFRLFYTMCRPRATSWSRVSA